MRCSFIIAILQFLNIAHLYTSFSINLNSLFVWWLFRRLQHRNSVRNNEFESFENSLENILQSILVAVSYIISISYAKFRNMRNISNSGTNYCEYTKLKASLIMANTFIANNWKMKSISLNKNFSRFENICTLAAKNK